jgi:nitroimidazol reductase NimA-like FMN-containing flavoprotein (pyridoxamine 5'-phosphate oxidase superfamily)
MRRKDKEITDRKLIEDIISKCEICRIAMVDDTEPYIVPVNYGFYKNDLYIHSAAQGRKIDVLRKNNRVCFEIELPYEIHKEDNACDWGTNYRSVIGYGTVEIISDIELKKKGLDIIMRQHGKTTENIYDDALLSRMVLLVLHIDEISGKQSGNWN